MIESAEIECSECHARHVVVPPTVGQFKDPSSDTPRVELPAIPAAAHLVEADATGHFTCKKCGATNAAHELGLG